MLGDRLLTQFQVVPLQKVFMPLCFRFLSTRSMISQQRHSFLTSFIWFLLASQVLSRLIFRLHYAYVDQQLNQQSAYHNTLRTRIRDFNLRLRILRESFSLIMQASLMLPNYEKQASRSLSVVVPERPPTKILLHKQLVNEL